MKLEELLKNDQETLKKVKEAIDKVNSTINDNNKKVRYTDLGEGRYVGVEKYNDIETKYNDLKNTPNEFETKYNDLVKEQDNNIKAEKDKLSEIAKKLAVDSAVSSLGINDDLVLRGIKSIIKIEDIKVDENYNITEGLDNQLKTIKETYKDSFNKQVQVVSTGTTDPKNNSTAGRKYSSLAEIRALSKEEVIKDLDNIQQQLPNLK